MNYSETLSYIHSVSGHFCKPGLERITALCNALGNPQRDLKFIHVAGTNGKGSFCAMTDAVLRAAGYRTGLYTSPYIKEFNERMRVDGENISNDELVELTATVKPYADAMTDKPTEFELITAIAFLYFKRHACDVVVLEVGLGGRLDSTNLIEKPLLSVITGIDFDHTDYLGDTLEQIASEKGGIIKEGCPVLYGNNPPSVLPVLKNIATEKNAPFTAVDHTRLQIRKWDIDGTVLDFGPWKELTLPLLGTYQPQNAANVLTAVELLNRMGMLISDKAVREGLRSVRWPARFERLREADPVIFYDGSHNPQGIASAVQTVEIYFPGQKVTVITGVMADKNYDVMIRSIGSIAQKVFTVTPANPRALPAEDYANRFRVCGVDAEASQSVAEGVQKAVAYAKATESPIICLGSLYLYGELAEAVQIELS